MEQNEICCPKFDPLPWDDKIIEWNKKKFIKDKVFTIFYMPMNFGSKIVGLIKKVGDSGANLQDNMCLSDHTSKWNMDIYMAVDREIPGADNINISGKFLSRVYEGKFTDTDKWCEDFKRNAKAKNLEIKKWYMWYTTCPKCAKKYGKNYVVVLGEI
jgi:hypothetical protein